VEKVTILGCGSLGGFLAYCLAQLGQTESLKLIDFDLVEEKNLQNSIYRPEDIGEFKPIALKKIIEHNTPTVEIETLVEAYKEPTTESIKDTSDLVIDCRDFIYDRMGTIDVRMYISSRYLVIDCRRHTEYETNHAGRYLETLNKQDIYNAAFSASMFIHKGLLAGLIEKQMVHKIELDFLDRDMADTMSQIKRKPDEILEYHSDDNKLINLTENLHKIQKINKKNDMTIFVGSKHSPIATKQISMGHFQDSNDIVVCLLQMVDLPYPFNNYVVVPKKEDGMYFIELLAETGAA